MRRMGFLGGSLILRGGVLRGVGGGRGVGVGLFEEGVGRGFFRRGVCSRFLLCMVVVLLLDCDDSSIVVVGRFCSCSAAVTAVAPM